MFPHEKKHAFPIPFPIILRRVSGRGGGRKNETTEGNCLGKFVFGEDGTLEFEEGEAGGCVEELGQGV